MAPRELPGASALPMLDVYLPMMRTAALLAAGELGLFERLARGAASAARLARSLRVDAHGVARLADVLVQAGYLRRRGARYANTPHAQRWFTSRGTVDYTPGLLWTCDAWSLTAELAGAIRRGGPRESLWTRMARAPGMGERFANYMLAFARHVGPQIVRAVTLPRGAQRLLDVGGSHGLHSIAFCRANPQLHAVVFDHAVSLRETAANVRAAGLQDRITTRAGDCTRDALGSGFDAVLYFSVAHNQSAATNARVIGKCARALRPGGLLVVQDYPNDRTPPAYAAAFDLTLLLEVGHRTHALAAFRGWCARAGLRRFRHVALSPSAMGSLMTAQKPSRRAARQGS